MLFGALALAVVVDHHPHELREPDRCDRCGARAYVRVLLPSRRELLFCAHHTREHARALAEIAVEIQDETQRLTRTAA